MNRHRLIKMSVTEEEEELIHAIRNYVKSYPDGKPELLWYVQQLFDNMIDAPKDNYIYPIN